MGPAAAQFARVVHNDYDKSARLARERPARARSGMMLRSNSAKGQHLAHRLACRCGHVEPLLMQEKPE